MEGQNSDVSVGSERQVPQICLWLNRPPFCQPCIYKVRGKLWETNPQAYAPSMITIGPINNPLLNGVDDVKQQFLDDFLSRPGVKREKILIKLKEEEENIRKCYAGVKIQDSGDSFINKILTDACFVIELFVRLCGDPTSSTLRDLPFPQVELNEVIIDLVLIHNQLPFYILEDIYNLAFWNANQSFLEVTLSCFEAFNLQNKKPDEVSPLHLTDLLRNLMLPASVGCEVMDRTIDVPNKLLAATELSNAGLKFKLSRSKCLLDLRFRKGVLSLPCFQVDKSTERRLRNIAVFELYHYWDFPLISEWLQILSFLAKEEKDVDILVQKNIITTSAGGANELHGVLQRLGSDLLLESMRTDYWYLADGLNRFGESRGNKYRAIFKRENMSSPCKIVGGILAIIVVLPELSHGINFIFGKL